MKYPRIVLLGSVCFFSLSACNVGSRESQSSIKPSEFVLSSSQMIDGGHLPIAYTCDGEGVSPALSWSGAPPTTKYYALSIHHNAPEGEHWYWTLYNINSQTTQLKSGETVGLVGSNSINNINEYTPPCSKGRGPKNYTYTIYALSDAITLDDQSNMGRPELLAAIKETTVATANMTVSYERMNHDDKPQSNKNNKVQPKPEPKPFTLPNLTVDIDSDRCNSIKQSVDKAGFAQEVSVTCDQDYAYLASSTYPDHELMTGISGTNEQVPVPANGYVAPIKLNPQKATSVTTIDAAVGVAVNGVPIYDYSSQGELDVTQYDQSHDTLVLGQLDNCGGHAGRGDDYHYHVAPSCMMDTMKNQSNDAIIGWAYDGYPLYGNLNPDGSKIETGQLDTCNAQTDETFGYRYHTSVTPPYIIQCLVGEVDTSKLPRVAPLSGDTEKIRADLKPPKGGVENLVYAENKDGSRSMTYSYQGEVYFTTYRPSSQEKGCFDFEQKTISNGGKIESGTFCRNAPSSELAVEEGLGVSVDADTKPEKDKPSKPKQEEVVNQSIALGQLDPSIAGQQHFILEAWADNWFAAYIGEDLLVEDSVAITTERSFNAESVAFSANYPIHLNLILKDFKQNDTGLEYIGASNQQMGDGGFKLQITDSDSQQVVAVSNNDWKCEVLHQAPLNKLCEAESNPIAGEGYCTFNTQPAPENWLKIDFDDSLWANASEHNTAAVNPKGGYDKIDWDDSAKIIWGKDLETDNTLICRTTIEQPN
tara:strand:- start:45 stop:2324 length:2280 start_codon:yes stop_codon:yes gene_type:complete